MPIYEYECQACAYRFEEWQKMSDKPIKVCPKCKARKVEKLISHTSFQLKGGGWGSDLYASAKPSQAAAGDKAGPAAAGEKTAAASDKPAASGSESSSSASKTTDSKGKPGKGGAKAAA